MQQVEKSDYGQKLGAIAGITGFKKDGSRYSGADFPAELLVFSGINSSQMDIFLAEYKKAGIEPIGCKAVVTPDNVFWSADKLFREIFREHFVYEQVNEKRNQQVPFYMFARHGRALTGASPEHVQIVESV